MLLLAPALVLSACGAPGDVASTTASGTVSDQARTYAIEQLAARSATVSVLAVGTSVTDHLPTQVWVDPDGKRFTLSDLLVEGVVADVAGPIGYANAGEDAAAPVQVPVAEADWQVFRAEVDVKRSVPDGADEVVVLFAVDAAADSAFIKRGFLDLGKVTLVLNGPATGAYEAGTYEVVRLSQLLGVVEPDGALTFPVAEQVEGVRVDVTTVEAMFDATDPPPPPQQTEVAAADLTG